MTGESNTRDRVARRILRYLLEHSAAADSAPGIVHWWLRDEGADEAVVRNVLDELARRGWLVTHGGAPAARVYGLDSRRRADVIRFVHGAGEHLDG